MTQPSRGADGREAPEAGSTPAGEATGEVDWAARAQDAFGRGQQATARGAHAEACRWLERARRISNGAVPVDVALSFARLSAGDHAGAAVLLRGLLERFDFREGWTALGAALFATGDQAGAADALHRALARHAPELAVSVMCHRIAQAAMAPGWCGLSGESGLLIDGEDAFRPAAGAAGRHEILLDGRRLVRGLPERWRRGRRLEVRLAGRPLLGSPIDIAAVLRSEGFVTWRRGRGEGVLAGWLWHPGEPERIPTLLLRAADGREQQRTVETFADAVDAEAPLVRPRHFTVAVDELPPGPVRLFGEDGRELAGSPIDGRLMRRLPPVRSTARPPSLSRPEPARPETRRPETRRPETRRPEPGRPGARVPACPGFDVVIPAYRDLRRTLACIEGARASVPASSRVLVIDDASPEPELSRALARLAARGQIVLLRNPVNLGFPRSANLGIEACGGRDVLLLNSDTLVAGSWALALRDAAYSAADVGSASPLSNDASILSYPDVRHANPVPEPGRVAELMAIAQRANRDRVVELPTAHGFCWYIRRDCLDQVGPLRDDVFAQGYGEENDFCRRAAALGWRHVAACGAYVGHVGGVSFSAHRTSLMRRNLAVLNRLHPGYDALVEAHIAADPLAGARRALDLERFSAEREAGQPAVLLITHDEAGGVERVVRARAASLRRDGIRALVLRPARGGAAPHACLVDLPQPGSGPHSGADSDARPYPNLRFALPDELDALVALLGGERILHAEWHHLLGHHPSLRALCRILDVPYDIHIHDYAAFCQRIALVGGSGRYCGEPDVAGCEACVAGSGSRLGEVIGPRALRERSAAEFAAARRVVAPSHDAARRLARHFPALRPLVRPLEDDAPSLPLHEFADLSPRAPAGARIRACVIGGIGIEKGFAVLLACVREAAARGVPLDFVVVGHTPDDDALLEAGALAVTGPYREDEATALVAAQQCDIAFLPSIWPETWCFTLTLAWRAGLPVAAFDIGAQAERIRRTGRGLVLPLGLPVAALVERLHHLGHAHRNAPQHTTHSLAERLAILS